jgi:hypothetical protein
MFQPLGNLQGDHMFVQLYMSTYLADILHV